MPWDTIRLNSGYSMPRIAFGTNISGDIVDQVDQALESGFDHVDTAQAYRNEAEVGKAVREGGLARSDVFITTKFSGTDGLDIDTSIRNSVANLGLDYLDMYLIHSKRVAVPDIPTIWKKMEDIKKAGLARSIGVCWFDKKDLEVLLASANIKPAVNQIRLNPYVYLSQRPTLEYAAEHGILIEAFGTLNPLTRQPGGPLDEPLKAITSRLGVTTDQVLLAWAKAKGAAVVITSSKKTRLQGYLAAGDIKLTQEDIDTIDAAGAVYEKRMNAKATLQKLAIGGLVGAVAFATCSYFNIRIF